VKPVTMECKWCGGSMPPHRSDRKHLSCNAQCSAALRRASQRKHKALRKEQAPVKSCPVCGQPPASRRHKYCSDACRRKVERSYNQKVYRQRHPAWLGPRDPSARCFCGATIKQPRSSNRLWCSRLCSVRIYRMLRRWKMRYGPLDDSARSMLMERELIVRSMEAR
jgi:hypothetical protein